MKGCVRLKELKIFDNNDKSINYISRTATKGKEVEMVNRYVNSLCNRYKHNKEKSLSIFIEPKIESGYPDIVIVEYKKKKIDKFYKREEFLNNQDLKILFESMRMKRSTVEEIASLLGYSNCKTVEKSIDKLLAYDLVRINDSGSIISSKDLKDSAISKIVAIEAKIDKWSEALVQANRNTWFATDSYIMLNKETCNENIIESCKKQGIGIILVNGKISKILKSESKKFPISYGSLLFWEWIIRKGEKKLCY